MDLLQKNQDVVLRIDSLGSEGQGVGRYEGIVVFVNGALPSELVRVHIIKRTSGYAVGKCMEIIESAKDRIVPKCPVFERCGGCTLQHLDYEAQLESKHKMVYDSLEHIGGIKNARELTKPIIGMKDPWRYRNKAAFPASQERGEVEFGLFAARSHSLIPINDCAIQDEQAVRAMRAVRYWATSNRVSAYDERANEGVLRHVVVRTTAQKKVMVIVVTSGALPAQEELVKQLHKHVEGLASVIHNINKNRTNVIFGTAFRTIEGEDTIEDTLCGMTFEISAQSFYQVNPTQAEILYNEAICIANPKKNEIAIDAYCGIGTITLALAKQVKKVIGIEIVPEAVADAQKNAVRNKVDNVEFICGPVEVEFEALLATGVQPDLLMLDPPRKGCDEALIKAVIKSRIPRIVYISCNPSTLARDIKLLTAGGFTLESAQPVDMFCHTPHVESIVLLQKKNS